MSNNSNYQIPRKTNETPRMVNIPRQMEEPDSAFDFDPTLDPLFTDNEEFAENFGLPITPFTEDDLRFLRDFILGTAMYVEELESVVSEQSDEFWQAREHAYRIITALLIRHYEYELEC
ncbi:MAG: hypothetical protein ACHQNE_01645 [Candidatus Kapaibacterium sp.]